MYINKNYFRLNKFKTITQISLGKNFFHVMSVEVSNDGHLEIGAILQSFKSTLDEIDKKLKKEIVTRFDEDFHVGQITAVKMGVKWFRAKITEKLRSEFFVELIDYGRIDAVRKENMAKLPDSAFLFPALHVKILVENNFCAKVANFRSILENIILGKKVGFEIIRNESETTWHGDFENSWNEKIREKFGLEKTFADPYVDMDPFNAPFKNHSPNGQINGPQKRSPLNSTGDSGILKESEKELSGDGIPVLYPILAGKRYDIRYGRYISSNEITIIISEELENFQKFEEKLQKFCKNEENVEKIKSENQLYAVKLPTNKWVRAIVNEKLTTKDAEMELIDQAQLRRCHIDQIVELSR